MHKAIAELLEFTGGIICRRQYPELLTRLEAAVRRGELIAVLPGVYVVPELASDWRTIVRAVPLWNDDAVVIGDAGAALTYWSELTPRTVEIACPRRARFQTKGITVCERVIPPELVTRIAGVPIAVPALNAIDLIPRHGGDVIDRALRSRMATLADMYRALDHTPGRRGNGDRRRMLLDSRGEPWSEAERLSHRILRGAGMTRWHANVPIVCNGHKYFQDILMDDCPVVLEIDGMVHLRREMFETDRRRGNELLLAGRYVLHFTWLMLNQEPDWFISTTQGAIALVS
jgi:very-short-patch-repair endonuclease